MDGFLQHPPPMLVYGDATRREETADALARLRTGVPALLAMSPGLARHAALAGQLIAAGELAQGLLDDRLAADGAERPSPLAAELGYLTLSLAEALRASFAGWSAGSWTAGDALLRAGLRRTVRTLDRLAGHDLPASVEVKVPEGYAIYALYPEAYLAAAARLGRPGEAIRVIGIRSIGTSLAPAVAATLGAPPPVTVRPAGHPFARRLDLSPALARRLAGARRYAVVDEGPGLSGSSFGAVADWLEGRGVTAGRLVFFPGHAGGPGPRASRRHRARWARARRLTASFEELFLSDAGTAGRRRLGRWTEDLAGPALAPPEDLGGGRWRARLFAREEDWPPVHREQERRKYLVEATGGPLLLKFVGLGRYGDEAHERARILAKAGFGPPAAGLRHGFLAMPWLAGARPLSIASADRAAWVDRAASYLAFIARRFPAPPGTSGASPACLLAMARHNAAEALGEEEAEPLRAFAARLPDLARRARPVLGDHRLQPWEWLLLPDGRLVKTDGLDHWRGHDLVGAQDPAWDLAGAIEELDLAPEEAGRLLDRWAQERGEGLGDSLLRFYRAAYLAFQLGRHAMAREAAQGDPPEAARHARAEARYGDRLRALLAAV